MRSSNVTLQRVHVRKRNKKLHVPMTVHSRRTQHHSQHRGRLTRADKMNIVLLIAVTFTLALGHERNEKPCQETKKNEPYKRFVERHIVESIPKSKEEWAKYLEKKGLCGRAALQFFVKKDDEERVKQICEGDGWYQEDPEEKNLCISKDKIEVHDVTKDDTCKVTDVQEAKKYVIVACDKTKEEGCRPVHYHKNTDVLPANPVKCQQNP